MADFPIIVEYVWPYFSLNLIKMRKTFLSVKALVLLSASASMFLFSCSKQEEVIPNNSIGVHNPKPSDVIGDLIGVGASSNYYTGNILDVSWDTGTFYSTGMPPSGATTAKLEFQVGRNTVLEVPNAPIQYLNNTANNLYGHAIYSVPTFMTSGVYHLKITPNNGYTYYINGVGYTTLEGDVNIVRRSNTAFTTGVFIMDTFSSPQGATTFFVNWNHAFFAGDDLLRFYVKPTDTRTKYVRTYDLGEYSSTYVPYDGRGAFDNSVSGPQNAVCNNRLPAGEYEVTIGNVVNTSFFPQAVGQPKYQTGGVLVVNP